MFDFDVRSSLGPGAAHGCSIVLHVAGLGVLTVVAVSAPPPVRPAVRLPAVFWLAPVSDPAPPGPVPRAVALSAPQALPQFNLLAPVRVAPARRAVPAPPLALPRMETPANPLPLEPAPQALPAPRIQTDLFAGLGLAAGSPRSALVATGGFSSAQPVPAAAPVAPVRSAGFGDAAPAAPVKPPPKIEITGPTLPVEILAKPHLSYTEEARRLQIEGEVMLRVLFTASGRVEVLSLVRGLGHGLDERAAEAARRMRFRPAQEQGRPVDCAALVHMTFQLAY